MKLFKYDQFINESKEDIRSICKRYHIKDYTINENGSIDVNEDVDLSHKILTKLPLKFRNVSGNFNCGANELTSLEGCPQSLGGDFDCGRNKLTSLEGCPQSIGGDFYGPYNQISDFKGFPEYFEGDFYFGENPVHEILQLFKYHQKSIDWINEHDVIQGRKVILKRLEEVYYELKMELPENIELYNYEII